MSCEVFEVPERVKLVFIDGNINDGKVIVKRGTITKADDNYLFFIPEEADKDKIDACMRIGHNFVIKTVPLNAEEEFE